MRSYCLAQGTRFNIFLITYKGKESEKEYIYIAESLCHIPESTISSVQSLSRVWLFATSWTAAHQASLSITNSRSLLKLLSIKLVMPSNYPILCCPLLFLPSVFPRIRVFSSESVPCIRGPKYWSFSFSISLFNEYLGLISFRIDCLDLTVQGTLNSLLQHYSSKASILRRSTLFMVQLTSICEWLLKKP